MKRGTDQLIKFRLLQQRLGLNRRETKSILQEIWDLAAVNCPQGDLGRFSDAEIAFGIDYEGDSSALIRALVDTGWLDEESACRLYIHDWHEHCEDHIHAQLARARQTFANGVAPKLSKLSRDERADAEKYYSDLAANGGSRQPAAPGGARRRNNAACLSLSLSLNHSHSLNEKHSSAQPVVERVGEEADPASDSNPDPEPRPPSEAERRRQAEAIYALYPRKVGKGKAITAIIVALKTVPFEDLQAAVAEYAASEWVQTSEEQFIPHPATWFHQQRWADDRREWHRSRRNGTVPLLTPTGMHAAWDHKPEVEDW
jgi:hypothetical protein